MARKEVELVPVEASHAGVGKWCLHDKKSEEHYGTLQYMGGGMYLAKFADKNDTEISEKFSSDSPEAAATQVQAIMETRGIFDIEPPPAANTADDLSDKLKGLGLDASVVEVATMRKFVDQTLHGMMGMIVSLRNADMTSMFVACLATVLGKFAGSSTENETTLKLMVERLNAIVEAQAKQTFREEQNPVESIIKKIAEVTGGKMVMLDPRELKEVLNKKSRDEDDSSNKPS